MGLTESMKALGHWLHWPNPSVVASTDATHVSVREPNPSFSDNVNLLNAAGIPLLGGLVAASEEEAVQQAEAIGFPVVMKGMNPAVLHKTDAGLVHLGISNGDETRTAYRSITSALNRVPVERARNEIIIQPTAKPGLELILGVRNVPYFGTLIVLGLGGIYVEVLRKIACRLAPVDKHGVRDMLRELSLEAIFSGFRGTAPYDVDALAKVVVSLEQLAVANFDAVEFLELNPLIVHRRGEGVTGLDVLIDRPAPVSPSVQTADI
jgi:succinyl-CoA synthetase beta subunit